MSNDREPVSASEALLQASAHYADDGRRGDDDARPSIAYVGRDVPREVLLAARRRPVRLRGRPGDTCVADRYCGASIDPVARTQLSRILGGELAGTDGLVVSADCEGSVRLFLYLREIHRLDPTPGVPRFTFVDVVHLPHRTSLLYTRTRLAEFVAQLREWTGQPLDDEALRHAITLGNRARRAGRGLQELRTRPGGPLLTGTQSLHLTALGLSSTPDHFVATARTIVDDAAQLRPRDGVRVFLTGSSHDTDAAYRGIEERGAVVVGEDHDWGALAWSDDVVDTADPLTALAQAYSRNAPTAAGFGIRERAEHTVRAAIAARAQLVVAWLRRGDEAPAWDVPSQRAGLARHGIPLLVLPAQPYTDAVAPSVLADLDEAIAAADRTCPSSEAGAVR